MILSVVLLIPATVLLCHAQDYTNTGQWIPPRASTGSPFNRQRLLDHQNATFSGQSLDEIEFINGDCVYWMGELNDNGAKRNLTEVEKQQLLEYLQEMDSYAQNLDRGIFQVLRDFFSYWSSQNDDVQNAPSSQNQQSNGYSLKRQNPEGNSQSPYMGTFPNVPCFCKSC
ncbi:hypothetical protein QR680_005388 [Steinernema hermaphroditum]|uniref:Pepsin inhibitor-3-like repeated domain-containing protein n=1 Tax=Steinernema hermaphroditum TaxID=289476 RepID=A0AA39HU11_9BILA|nr:hypothetical protein QR680_005388 [Steinernema hermaphroditum]